MLCGCYTELDAAQHTVDGRRRHAASQLASALSTLWHTLADKGAPQLLVRLADAARQALGGMLGSAATASGSSSSSSRAALGHILDRTAAGGGGSSSSGGISVAGSRWGGSVPPAASGGGRVPLLPDLDADQPPPPHVISMLPGQGAGQAVGALRGLWRSLLVGCQLGLQPNAWLALGVLQLYGRVQLAQGVLMCTRHARANKGLGLSGPFLDLLSSDFCVCPGLWPWGLSWTPDSPSSPALTAMPLCPPPPCTLHTHPAPPP